MNETLGITKTANKTKFILTKTSLVSAAVLLSTLGGINKADAEVHKPKEKVEDAKKDGNGENKEQKTFEFAFGPFGVLESVSGKEGIIAGGLELEFVKEFEYGLKLKILGAFSKTTEEEQPKLSYWESASLSLEKALGKQLTVTARTYRDLFTERVWAARLTGEFKNIRTYVEAGTPYAIAGGLGYALKFDRLKFSPGIGVLFGQRGGEITGGANTNPELDFRGIELYIATSIKINDHVQIYLRQEDIFDKDMVTKILLGAMLNI